MDTDTQQAAVEGILSGEQQCCRCRRWVGRSLLRGTVDPNLLQSGYRAGMVCIGCMCQVYPRLWDVYLR